MSGTLYVVATPIGNLEDVTLRALRILRDVSLIAAEDTRRTARLLQHYSISTPTTSLHEHNERARAPRLIERLQQGESVALVTDAGTPGVSDPGAHLVAEARAAGIRVEAIPGPSAVMAALSIAGITSSDFSFLGFPPAKGSARRTWFNSLADERRTAVFFEAPHRIRQTLEEMLRILGDRPISLARELTKTHEELVVKPITAHLEALVLPVGEFTVVVPVTETAHTEDDELPSDEEIAKLFWRLTESGQSSRREVARKIGEQLGASPNWIYRRLGDLGL